MSFPISIILNINIISNDLSLLSRIYIKKKYDATVAQNESVSLFNIFFKDDIRLSVKMRDINLNNSQKNELCTYCIKKKNKS